jgi:FeS assembly SUF system protein
MNASEELRDKVIQVLRTIHDPEIPVNIYDLGLIYEIQCTPEGLVRVRMTLTAPNCPVAGSLPAQVESRIRELEGVKDVQLDLVFDPPWNRSMMSEAAKLELGMDDLISIEGSGR